MFMDVQCEIVCLFTRRSLSPAAKVNDLHTQHLTMDLQFIAEETKKKTISISCVYIMWLG